MSDVATRPSASPGWLVWTRLMRHRLALASLVFLLILLVLSLAAPWIADWRGIAPTATDLFRRFEPSIGWAPTISAAISSSACSTADACRCWSASRARCCRRSSAR